MVNIQTHVLVVVTQMDFSSVSLVYKVHHSLVVGFGT